MDAVHVAVDGVGNSRHSLGTAKHFHSEIEAACREIAARLIDVIADVEVRQTVPIHISESRAGAPTWLTETGFQVGFLEGPVSSIEIQNVGTLICDKEIRISVVVDVGDSAAPGPPTVRRHRPRSSRP